MQNAGMQGSTPLSSSGYAEDTAERASAGLNRLSDSAQQTLERFTHAASEAASRLSAHGEALMHGERAEQARQYMRAHPLATIGIAVAIGLVLSRLLSRR
jgi:ElaB/YqjD/DUF883 family membrane-anchored ribosome-binding protein